MITIFAHGVGVRADLPVPVSVAQYAAVAVLVVTFLFLLKAWRQPKFEAEGGRPVPRLQRFVDSSVTSGVLRALGLAAFVLTLAALLLDTNEVTPNPATTWFYVWFWVGIVPASILLGPIWRRIDPLPSFSSDFRKVLGRTPDRLRPYPSSWGHWPAAAGLLAFLWLELVAPERSTPENVALFIILYSVVHVVCGVVFGPVWHERAASFSAYSDLAARVGPWMRTSDGRLVFANPLRNLAAFPSVPGSLATVVVLLGATAFDGITRTRVWTDKTADMAELPLALLGTAALLAAIALITVTFKTAIEIAASYQRTETSVPRKQLPGMFVHSLIPIAIGYAIAHYFSLFVFQGQAGFILASDPFDRGWTLFGSPQKPLNYNVVSPSVIAWVQVLAIVIGHIVGVLAAHDRSTKVFRDTDQRNAEMPLMLVMVVYTFAGIGLLLSGATVVVIDQITLGLVGFRHV